MRYENDFLSLPSLKNTLKKISKDKYLIVGKRKIFSEKEILNEISQSIQWPANFQVFFKVFIEQGVRCNYGLVGACLLAVELLLLFKDEHWYIVSQQMSEYKNQVLQALNGTLTEQSLDLSILMHIQKSLFAGNSLGYNKELVDSSVIEAFVQSLGHFSVQTIKDSLRFVWEKNLSPGSEVFIIPGLNFSALQEIPAGSYKVVHFTNSKILIGIPNTLESVSYNNESVDPTEKTIQNLCSHIKNQGVSLIICQKLISSQMKAELKNIRIRFIERIGTENSNNLTKSSKILPVNSVFLLNPKDIFELNIKEFPLPSNKSLKYIESNQQTIIIQSILQEDFDYIQEVFTTSFQVLLNFILDKKNFDLSSLPNNTQVDLKISEYLSSIPNISYFLSHFSLSVEGLSLFLHCSPLDLSSLDSK